MPPFFLRYPIPGYNPTRALPPSSVQVKVNYLNECICGLLQYKTELQQQQQQQPTEQKEGGEGAEKDNETKADECAVMISEVFDQLSTAIVGCGPYLVVAELCPFVVRLAKGEHLLAQYFEFLEGCFERSYYVWLLEVLLKHYGLVWKTCPLTRAIDDCFKDAPPPKYPKADVEGDADYGHSYTGLDALEAVQCIFECVDVPEEIYNAEVFNSLCEDFVFIKFQTAADLQQVYPSVWWSTTHETLPQKARDAAVEASGRVEKTYMEVRKRQYGIVRAIAKRGKIYPWLSNLVERNKDYNKMVVPTGLSSLMMMTNAFHLLARYITSDDFKKDYNTVPETLFYNVFYFFKPKLCIVLLINHFFLCVCADILYV